MGSALLSGSDGVATAMITASGGQLGTGAKTITASYAGAAGFTPSAGSATVTVSATNSVVVPSVEPSPVYKQTPDIADPAFSHASFNLSPGLYSLTIEVRPAQILGEGFFRVQNVPELSYFGLFVVILALCITGDYPT